MMHIIRMGLTLAVSTVVFGLPVAGQAPQAGHRPGKLEALNASYHRELRALECRWIADLAALAENSRGAEADAAYQQLFNLAIARSLCTEARAAADALPRVGRRPRGSPCPGRPGPGTRRG